MLNDEEKQHLRAEEIFRQEIRRDIGAGPHNEYKATRFRISSNRGRIQIRFYYRSAYLLRRPNLRRMQPA